MGRLSDAVMNDFLDAYFGNQPVDIAGTYYVGLSDSGGGAAPTNTGGNVSEPSGGGYARVAVANNTTNWNTATGRATSNKTVIGFPTATDDWGDITHFVIYRSATGTSAADFVGWGALDTAITVVTGGTPDFPVGAIVIDAPGA